MKTPNKIFSIITSALLSFSTISYAEDWSAWRGNDQTGISKESKWKSEGIKKVSWKKELGLGYASVAVKGDNVVTLGWNNGKDTVYCLNTANGEPKWTYSYTCSKGGGFSGPRATPVIDGNLIYTLSTDGHLHCIDLKKGNVKWMKNVSSSGAQNIRWKFSSPALIQGDLVIVNAGKAGMAFNKNLGEKVWGNAGTGGYASPVPFKFKGKAALAIFSQKSIYAVDLKTGKELWSFPWETSYDVNAADPIIVGETMFISSGYGRGCALLDFSSGKPKLKWETKDMNNHFSSSIIHPKMKNVLIGCNGNTGKGNLAAIDLNNGKQLWTLKTGFVSLFYAGDRLISLSERGHLIIGKATDKALIKLVDTQLEKAKNYWSMPILSNGKLYCRGSSGKLTCLDLN
jgi:outer membrane protein assembly factor BamB